MSSTLARPQRFLLTLGLAVAMAATLPLSAGAEGVATRVTPVAATALRTVLNHPPAWTAEIVRTTVARLEALAAPQPVAPAPAALKVAAAPKPAATKPKATATKTAAVRVYAGRNYLWIPTLGVSHSVAFFSCTRSTAPGAGVYRWGCAGSNNTYLFGHAWSTFKPLHDAYVAGRLRTGMIVYYGDAAGRVRRYKVTAIKVVTPDQTGWAIAAQSVPSLTLQTCVGSRSQYRLLVRLVVIR